MSDPELVNKTALHGKSVVVLMATLDDWRSVAKLLPDLDVQASNLGVNIRIIVVDDGSIDLAGREDIASMSFVSITAVDDITLNRNFGNQRAVAIGVAHVAKNLTCDYLVVMDSDHEDNPKDIPGLLTACVQGGNQEIVFAERRNRPEGFAFQLMYSIYKWLFYLLTGIQMSMGNFSVIPGHLIRRIAHMDEIWVHYPAGVVRSRLPTRKVPADKGERIFGKSKMRLVNLILHAFGGFSVFADHVAVRVLIAMFWCIALFLVAVVALILQKYYGAIDVIGWTSQALAIIFAIVVQIVIGSVLLIFLIMSQKTNTPLVPIHHFGNFVLETVRLYPSKKPPDAS
jgi:polyisoprenyl-phosphate glycosyltransferase